MRQNDKKNPYWTANLKILSLLLGLWFLVSFVLSIGLVDLLDHVRVAGFRLGFWMAQQGAIFVFVLLIFAYIVLMDRLDRKHGYRALDEAGNENEDLSRPGGQHGREAGREAGRKAK